MQFLKDKRLAASVGWTYLKARKSQTIVAVASIAFGIMMYVSMVGFMTGLNDFTGNLIFNTSPHVRFYNTTEIATTSILDKANDNINIISHAKPKSSLLNLKDASVAIRQMQADPAVRVVSGVVSFQSFFHVGKSTITATINGIDPEAEDKMFHLKEKTLTGNYDQISAPADNIVLGHFLARKLNVQAGDNVTVTTNEGHSFNLKVAGLIKTGLMAIDEQQAYMNIATAQKMMGVPSSYITEIKLSLQEKEAAPVVKAKYSNLFTYHGSDYLEDNAVLLQGEGMRNIMSYAISITLLLVAGFGIYNILTMMIYDKMKEIAILKATGFSNKDVKWIFLTLALTIGIVGAIAGLIFGFLMAFGISKVPYKADMVVSMDHLPVSFSPSYYITGFLFGIITAALASYFPSRKASKVDPITILRG
ncbi:ABC transporter permease [Haoranjiania flava]|uniref:FtsX-like permease family protein n=1 Tax=Haoranjiania flava TaxID=1856322 RepID=A0AAE3ILT3_9BACT|nr:FtsX-like permease family protein [Haoranjiania flava]MCU7694203.1 FtsX-like permease family protein [Haoranjiania flava]